MNLLVLVEGDAETPQAWSGIAHSVVAELRARGHRASAGDVDLHGLERLMAAAAVFSPDRKRWGVKYRLLPSSSRRRSRRAEKHIRANERDLDLILQIGASFDPLNCGAVPYVLYCDSSILAARHGVSSGFSPASLLTDTEFRSVLEREQRVYQGAAAVFTISERLRLSFIEDFGLPPERVRTIHAGPNFDASRIPSMRPMRSGEAPTILFVGAQFERKGGDVLIAAFKKVRAQFADARLVIIGPERIEISEPGVETLGYLSKNDETDWQALAAAYQNADVFCLPTRFEPFGVVFLEAMHFGLPCVGTNVWAVPEMIEDGTTGYVVPVDDVPALAERLMRLLSDQELARRMGAAGRERALQYFSWSAVIDRLLSGVNDLLPRAVSSAAP